MDTPQGEHLRDRSATDRQYPGDSHRRRDSRCLRDRLHRLRAVRFSGPRHRLHSARAGGAGHARRGAVARTGAGGPRHRRRLRHACAGFFRQTGLLGAVHLSSHRHRGGLRPGTDQAVALACRDHHRVRAAVDLALPAMRPVDGRTARVACDRRVRARRTASGMRTNVRPARRRRPDRADFVRLARGLPCGLNDDRAREFPYRRRHHRVRSAGGRHNIRGMARAGRHRRGRRRSHFRVRRVCRMGGSRQSGHAGAARRAGHCPGLAPPPPTVRSRCT
jgi:hypothetical protein